MPNRTPHQSQDSNRSQKGQQTGGLNQESQRKDSFSNTASERVASDRDIQPPRADGSNERQPRDAKGRFTDDDVRQRPRPASSRPGRSSLEDQPRDPGGRFTDDDR